MQANNLFRHLVSRTVSRRSYRAGEYIPATYNDLPVPQGSWKTHYDANQRKFNAQLAFGIIFFIGTLIGARAGGFLDMNYSPPARPADKQTYK